MNLNELKIKESQKQMYQQPATTYIEKKLLASANKDNFSSVLIYRCMTTDFPGRWAVIK